MCSSRRSNSLLGSLCWLTFPWPAGVARAWQAALAPQGLQGCCQKNIYVMIIFEHWTVHGLCCTSHYANIVWVLFFWILLIHLFIIIFFCCLSLIMMFLWALPVLALGLEAVLPTGSNALLWSLSLPSVENMHQGREALPEAHVNPS